MSESEPAPGSQRWIRGIMLAVAIWGSLLALGALLFGPDPATGKVTLAPSLVRGAIVGGCVALFLGWWGWLLRKRARSK